MWKMRLLKSIEFYRKGIENPWRVSLLLRGDGRQVIELTSPAVDTDKVRLGTLTKADYNMMLEIITRAVNPDEIHQQIEKGWQNGLSSNKRNKNV